MPCMSHVPQAMHSFPHKRGVMNPALPLAPVYRTNESAHNSGSGYRDDYCVLGYDTVWSGSSLTKFQGTMLSRFYTDFPKYLRNVVTIYGTTARSIQGDRNLIKIVTSEKSK
jgi:hypothetical protein